MATFVVLGCFSDQGIRHVKDSPKRAEAFKAMAAKHGVTVKHLYWTLGQYDIVSICEAPDDESASALAFSVGSLGNLRTETLRAFSHSEIGAILAKMA